MMLKHEKKCLDLWLRQCQIKGSIKDRSRESRIFSWHIASSGIECGFYTCSKANKLPYETISATYDLEYGTDTLEIHADAIQKETESLYTMMF
jgi:adenine phosphoribosyltransferase